MSVLAPHGQDFCQPTFCQFHSFLHGYSLDKFKMETYMSLTELSLDTTNEAVDWVYTLLAKGLALLSK